MKQVCHRFLPIDRYNRYESNQIYRFSSIYRLINGYRFLSFDYSGVKFRGKGCSVFFKGEGKSYYAITGYKVLRGVYLAVQPNITYIY